MKKEYTKYIFRLYAILLSLLIIIGIGIVLVSFSYIRIVDPKGNTVLSDWPIKYTKDFSKHIKVEKEYVFVDAKGIKSLSEEKLWFQLLNSNGVVEKQYGIKHDLPEKYFQNDLIKLNQSDHAKNETVFVQTYEKNGIECTYIIGFPMDIQKTTMYLNGQRFSGGKSLILIVLGLVFISILFLGAALGIWLSRRLKQTTQSLDLIVSRMYEPFPETGLFKNVYSSLNEMDDQIRASDASIIREEQLKEEWIANITHDLKTPLSPIKGYTELLLDSKGNASPQKIINYSEIILKNVDRIETLVEDLKLTYQLSNYMIPINKEHQNISRLLKETIIEILNNPENAKRQISFSEKLVYESKFLFDQKMMKRAVDNLIYNSLVHNPPATKVEILLEIDEQVVISVNDDGKGMTDEECENLFKRYYRGQNTEKENGTGLGMAIVRQIVDLHDGEIRVESKVGKGTQILLIFPNLGLN